MSMRLVATLVLGILSSGAVIAGEDPDRPRGGASDAFSLARTQTAVDVHAIEVFLRSRFTEARRAFDEGRYERSYKICEAILVLAPEVSFQGSLLDLRRRAHGRYLSRSAVSIRFEPELVPEGESAPVTPIAELRGRVLLENRSQEAIVIGSSEEVEPLMGMVQFRVRSVFENSSESTESGTQVLRLLEGLRLEPGESRGISITLPLPVFGRIPVLQEWSVTGTTRPIVVHLADKVTARSIPWIESRGTVFAEGFSKIGERPLIHLRRALLEANPARLAAAGDCWLRVRAEVSPSTRKESDLQVIEDLLAVLGRNGGRIDLGVVQLLEKITGEFRERSVNSWRIWELTRSDRGVTEERENR
ncbi:MAG TPA: hypothetical protein EYN00_03835 [Planctomycetes bacterium]|nr:hypothetical protein [Planctomycetota bacterium]